MNERKYCKYCNKLTECEHPSELTGCESCAVKTYKKLCDCDTGSICMAFEENNQSIEFHMECLVKKVDDIEKKLLDFKKETE